LVRDVEVLLAYIERQLPGVSVLSCAKRMSALAGASTSGIWTRPWVLKTWAITRRSSLGFSLIGACMSCRCTG